jgi:hypothetical protein
MTDKQESTTEAFYRIEFAYGKLVQAIGESTLAFWQATHSICKFRDKITRRQQIAIWILDTAERFAEWAAGESE